MSLFSTGDATGDTVGNSGVAGDRSSKLPVVGTRANETGIGSNNGNDVVDVSAVVDSVGSATSPATLEVGVEVDVVVVVVTGDDILLFVIVIAVAIVGLLEGRSDDVVVVEGRLAIIALLLLGRSDGLNVGIVVAAMEGF